MKKTLVIMLVALIGVGAQQAKAQIDFGVVAGLNVNKADFKNVTNNVKSGNRCGWFLGPKVEFTVPMAGIGVDASLLYSQRNINIEDAAGEKTNHLNTIEIPINLRYQFGFSSLAAAYIATGPQFGFNVGSKKIKELADDLSYFKVKNSVLTWNIGAGVKLLKHVEAGLTYNIALSKFAKYTGTQKGSLRSNTFQVHVGYFF